MEKLERKTVSVTSRSYRIWPEIFHQNIFLLRNEVLVQSDRLMFLVLRIIFTGEIRKKDAIPWTCEFLPGCPAVDPGLHQWQGPWPWGRLVPLCPGDFGHCRAAAFWSGRAGGLQSWVACWHSQRPTWWGHLVLRPLLHWFPPIPFNDHARGVKWFNKVISSFSWPSNLEINKPLKNSSPGAHLLRGPTPCRRLSQRKEYYPWKSGWTWMCCMLERESCSLESWGKTLAVVCLHRVCACHGTEILQQKLLSACCTHSA